MLKVKQERLRRGWSQTTLAYHTGMSVADISRIETGRTCPYPTQLVKLSRVLDLDIDALLSESDPESEGGGVVGGVEAVSEVRR